MNKKSKSKQSFCMVILIVILLTTLSVGCSDTTKVTDERENPITSPLTEMPTATQEENYDFAIDYYRLPPDIQNQMGEDYYEVYMEFVDAYLNYETNSYYGDVDLSKPYFWGVVAAYFPIFHADTRDAQYTDGVISWEYSSTAEEHQKIIVDFEEQINDYFRCLKKGDNEIVRAIELYRYYTSQITYDYSLYKNGEWLGDTNFDNSSGYCGLINKTGVCQSFSWAYCFLLTQANIDAYAVAGGEAPDNSHQWTLLKLDNKWYFADPTFDVGGFSLKHFGQTMVERENDGYAAKTMFYLGSDTYPVEGVFDLSDGRFQKLHILFEEDFILSYKVDRSICGIRYIVMEDSGAEIEKSFDLLRQ